MSSVVVDTDVVSYIFKEHSIGYLYEPHLVGRRLLISFMTLAELDRWTLQHNWSNSRREWLNLYLQRFTVLPYNRRLCLTWAEVTVAAQIRGRRIECADAWIAATALHYGVPLVTHNYHDYLGVPNLQLISHGT